MVLTPMPEESDRDMLLIEVCVTLRLSRQRRAAVEALQVEQAKESKERRARLADIEGPYDWYCALAYAKLHGFQTDLAYLQRVGQRASELLRVQGLRPGKLPHVRYGTVNTYPVSVLRQAFEEIRG